MKVGKSPFAISRTGGLSITHYRGLGKLQSCRIAHPTFADLSGLSTKYQFLLKLSRRSLKFLTATVFGHAKNPTRDAPGRRPDHHGGRWSDGLSPNHWPSNRRFVRTRRSAFAGRPRSNAGAWPVRWQHPSVTAAHWLVHSPTERQRSCPNNSAPSIV